MEPPIITNPDLYDQPILTASDVKEGAGLSYRQLNDWEEKGILPSSRQEDSQWRRFSPRELFCLMICTEIRTSFGVPLESLTYIQSVMFEKGANHLKFTISRMKKGLAIWLLTDLKGTFILDTDLEFEDLLHAGIFRSERSQNYIFIKLNPIVNKLLQLKNLSPIKTHSGLYDAYDNADKQMLATNPSESELLLMSRDKGIHEITVHLKNGKIERLESKEDLSEEIKQKVANAMPNLLKKSKYQTITIAVNDGKVVRVLRKTPLKH